MGRTAASIAVGLAVVSALGWIFHTTTLAGWLAEAIPMAPSTAAGVAILGLAILTVRFSAEHGGLHRVAMAAVSAVSAFGLVVAITGAFWREFSIENLVFPRFGTLDRIPLGRMSPATGAGILLVGIAVVIHLWRRRHSRHETTASSLFAAALAMSAVVLGLVFVLGYILGSPLMYGSAVVPMALPTAVALVALGIGSLGLGGSDPFRPVIGNRSTVRARLMGALLPLFFVIMLVELVWVLSATAFRGLQNPIPVAVLFVVFTILTGIAITAAIVYVGRAIENTETSLRNSRALLTESERISVTGGWEWDVIEDRFRGTAGWCRIHGIDERTMTLAELHHLAHSDDIPTIDAAFENALAGTADYDLRHRVVDPSTGEVRTVHAHAEVVRDGEGRPLRMIGAARDVTDEVTREQAHRDSERRYRSLVENAPDAIFVADADTGILLDANRGAELLTGRNREELVGLHHTALHPATDREFALAAFQEAAPNRTSPTSTLSVLHPGGRVVPVEISATCMVDQGGRRVRIGFFRDISIRRELEDRLRQSEKMDAIGQLAGGIAHDFNNQLAAILGFAEMLTSRLTEDSLRDSATRIVRAAERAGDLTRQLLAFARRGAYRSMEVDVHELVDEVAGLLQRSVDKSVRIELDLAAGASFVTGDPAQLQTALLNLGLNARDAMPDGGVITIATSIVSLEDTPAGVSPALDPGTYLAVRISDTGHGMDEETQRHVFEPFFTTKDPGKGTGMGLAAVYATISACHGAIGFTSGVGEGTAFTVYLPLTAAPEKQEVAVEPQTSENVIPPARVLVVDDEDLVRESILDMLESFGHKPTGCADGAAAVDLVRLEPDAFDLVVLDMTMPVMGGREVLLAIRDIVPTLPVILSSGHSLEREACGLLDLEWVMHLQKPYGFRALQAAIHRMLAPSGGMPSVKGAAGSG